MATGWSILDGLNAASKAAVEEKPKARFRTRDINIKKMYSNDRNFYSVSDIEELAQLILAVGLLENMTVVYDPCERGEYRIIAGERRWRALNLLLERGHEEFEVATCQIKTPAEEHEETVQLIAANAYRSKTVMDILEEEKRLKESLQYMKENGLTLQGYKLDSGRLRDVIADIMNTTTTKVAQIESINKRLIPEFTQELKEGRLTFSAAYEISGMDEDAQKQMLERYRENGLTWKEVRETKKAAEEAEKSAQIEGQMNFPEDYEEPEKEPVSILGYPLRVYPEGSLISTPGCGKNTCFSCHRDGCEIRQEECYCVEAPMGNPFPCTTLNVVDNLRNDIGSTCQFVNEDLAFHRAGDGQPVPCCKKCNNPCGYECRRSVEKRHADTQDKESDKTKPENHEKSSCPPDVHSCIRQEWGTEPEQQHEGAKECAKCWSEWKKRQEVVGVDDKTVIKPDESVIKQDDSVDIPEDNVIKADFPELEKSEDEQIPEPDESWNIGDLPQAPERYLKALARVLVEAKGIQMVISPAREKYLSDESIEKRIKELDKENGGCIHLGDSVLVYASQEIIEFYEGNTDLGVCSYKRFANQVRKVMDSWEPGQDAAENTENPEICCTNCSEPDDVTYSEIAIRDYLEEEERTLEEYERVNGVERLPQNLMMRQRMLVKALKLLLESEKEVEEPEEDDETEDGFLKGKEFMTCARNSLSNLNVEIGHKAWKAALSSAEHLVHYLRLVMDKNTEQPEIPVLKNNDQRKEWLNDYKSWGLWYRDENIDVNYYKYDFSDGSRLVVAEYPQRRRYWNPKELEDVHYYHLLEKNRKYYGSEKTFEQPYMHDTDSETYLVEFLKNLQRGGKK